jgi:hypothetical protein
MIPNSKSQINLTTNPSLVCSHLTRDNWCQEWDKLDCIGKIVELETIVDRYIIRLQKLRAKNGMPIVH